MYKKILTAVLWTIILSASMGAKAQYFQRNYFQIPMVGWIGFDDSLFALNDKKWGIGDQVSIGAGYGTSFAYGWWFLSSTEVGFGAPKVAAKDELVGTLNVSVGVKHNFMQKTVRPYLGIHVHYMQYLGSIRRDETLGAPIWVGIRPALGIEWFVAPDMSVSLEGGYTLFVNLDDPFRHVITGKLSYNLYF